MEAIDSLGMTHFKSFNATEPKFCAEMQQATLGERLHGHVARTDWLTVVLKEFHLMLKLSRVCHPPGLTPGIPPIPATKHKNKTISTG